MTSTGPRPLHSAARAIVNAVALIGKGTYVLGARDVDASQQIFDCFSFAIRYCYGLPGHRPGFNRGWSASANFPAGATVVDDLNSNSAIEDAFHAEELFEVVRGDPRVGDVLAYPTIPAIRRADGTLAGPWVGHAALVAGVSRAIGKWVPTDQDYTLLDIIECVPRTPAIRRSTGAAFEGHQRTWPNPQQTSYLLRVKP